MSANLKHTPQDAARTLLHGVKQLPALPDTATAIMTSLTDEFVTLEKVAAILEKDPALTARILGLANSAYYSQKQEISSVRDAIIRVLGLDLTRGVALGIALGGSFDTCQCPSFDVGRFWSKSLYAAAINTCLLPAMIEASQAEKQLAFVAGLISQIGLLVLAVVAPNALQEALAADMSKSLSERLEESLGFDDHCVAMALLEVWALPSPLIAVVGYANDPDHQGPYRNLVTATAFSLRVAEHILEGKRDSDELGSVARQLGVYERLERILAGEAKELDNLDGIAGFIAR